MSNYYTRYANGSMNPFRGEIKQEPVVGREDGVIFPEEDREGTSWTMMCLARRLKRKQRTG